MTTSPLVSVIIPSHDVAGWLGATLDSVLSQSHDRLQVIVVDDGSTDDTLEVAERRASGDARIELVQQANRGPGPGGGRNGGLDHVRGDYLMFIDGDDLLHHRAITRLVEPMTSDKRIDFSTIGVSRLEGSVTWPSQIHRSSHRVASDGTTLAQSPWLADDTTPWNKLWRVRRFEELVGTWPERILYEDTEPMARAHLAAGRIAVVSASGYYWRRRSSGSITAQRPRLDALEAQLDATTKALTAYRSMPEAHRWFSWRVLTIDLVWLVRQLLRLRGSDRARFAKHLADTIAATDGSVRAHMEPHLDRGWTIAASGDPWRTLSWVSQHRGSLHPDPRTMDEAQRMEPPVRIHALRHGKRLGLSVAAERASAASVAIGGRAVTTERAVRFGLARLEIDASETDLEPSADGTLPVALSGATADRPLVRGAAVGVGQHARIRRRATKPGDRGPLIPAWHDGRLVVRLAEHHLRLRSIRRGASGRLVIELDVPTDQDRAGLDGFLGLVPSDNAELIRCDVQPVGSARLVIATTRSAPAAGTWRVAALSPSGVPRPVVLDRVPVAADIAVSTGSHGEAVVEIPGAASAARA